MTTTNASTGRMPDTGVRTQRRDRWWLPPLATVVGLTLWVAYATTRVFLQDNYWVAEHHYLTPFYSPCVSFGCLPEAAHFGRVLPDHPLIPFAAFSLPLLLLFRLTCYYYRKSYYRSYWLSPPSCSVDEPHRKYTGETRFPLIFQNAHRYTFYAALVITLINTYDAVLAFGGEAGIGMGLGNLILLGNVAMLWGYTLGCHSCRHITGGRLNHFSRHPLRYRWWLFVSRLNARHMEWAWVTLGTLVVADAYVMAVSAGWISDIRFF